VELQKIIIGNGGTGFGNCVFIDHGNGIQTRYGHGTKRLVEVGQTVKKGDPIMTVGDTGGAQGKHLHFSVKVNVDSNNVWWSGKFVDPMDYFNEDNVIHLYANGGSNLGNLNIEGKGYESTGMFLWPVPGVTKITSGYKTKDRPKHQGIDIGAVTGTTICAAASGEVKYAQYNEGGYGNLVMIDHRKRNLYKIWPWK